MLFVIPVFHKLRDDERDEESEQDIGKIMRAGGEPAYRHQKDKSGTNDI